MLGTANEPGDDERDLHQRIRQIAAHRAHQAHLSVLNEAIAGDGFDRTSSTSSSSPTTRAGQTHGHHHHHSSHSHHHSNGTTSHLNGHTHSSSSENHDGPVSREEFDGSSLASPHTAATAAASYQAYLAQHTAVDQALEKLQAEHESILDQMQKFRPLVPDESTSREHQFASIMANYRREMNGHYLQPAAAAVTSPTASASSPTHQPHHQPYGHQANSFSELAQTLAAGIGSPTSTSSAASRLFAGVTPPSMVDPNGVSMAAAAASLGPYDAAMLTAAAAGTLAQAMDGFGHTSRNSKSARQVRDASVASSGSDHLPALPPAQSLLGGHSNAPSPYDYSALAHRSPLNDGPSSPGAAGGHHAYASNAHSSSLMGGLSGYAHNGGGHTPSSNLYTPNNNGAIYGRSQSPMAAAAAGHSPLAGVNVDRTHSSRQPSAAAAPSSSSSSSAASSAAGGSGASSSSSTKRKRPTSDGSKKKSGSPRKKRGTLPKEAVKILRTWLFQHFENPYPTDEQKNALAMETGLAVTQVNYWFINARVRIWRPALESVSGDKGHASKIRSGKPKSHANKLYLQTAAAMALKNANWKS